MSGSARPPRSGEGIVTSQLPISTPSWPVPPNAAPPYAALGTMAVYTVGFTLIAVRFFRWE